MGSVYTGDGAGPSRCRGGGEDEVGEEYMEDAHGSYSALDSCAESMLQLSLQTPWPCPDLTPLKVTPQVSITDPLQRPEVEQHTDFYETTILTEITWRHEGHQVAIEGSWDNWKKREYLQRTDRDMMIMKVLPVGVYYYLFLVDGHRRYAPDLPQESDDKGNIFNVLDLQINILESEDNDPESESSPLSSYNNEHFALEDFKQKVPELSPFLQSAPMNRLQSSDEPQSQEKPLPCFLNHLLICKPSTDESLRALASTQRFGKKYVTMKLYKPFENL